jgi:hypothetical protein
MNQIKIKEFKGTLYRANNSNAKSEISGSVNYHSAPVKYFTLNKKELNAYTKYGIKYKKTWEVIDNLKLVDILDSKTRDELEIKFTNKNQKNALNKAFPIINGKVSRNSESTNIDNIVLKKICELGYDGYYMETINAFHSEVGLCKNAFSKLKLKESEKLVMPNRINKTKKRSRLFNNNNNNNNNKSNRNITFKKFNLTNNIPKFSSLF